ncbi:MAG: hypothetical protein MJB14_11885 [Spirochaetes bacterium]|nr:hypothetical protein [Spirochaetota bacterium]
MGFVKSFYSIRLLRIVLSIFFIILGFYGIMDNIDESIFSLNNTRNFEVIFGVIELVCGLLLLLGFFAFHSRGAVYWGGVIVFIFWLVRVVLTKVIWCLHISSSTFAFRFRPDFYQWLLALATELIIAVALLVIIRRYD